MKIYGYIKELVELWFRKDSQDVKITPNSNTYVGTTTFSLPPKTSGSTTLVDVDGSQTLTNKTLGSGTALTAGTLTGVTIDADLNTLSNIENADIKAGAAIDATKLADGSVSNTELQYINSLTSNAQTQLDAKQPLDSDLTAIAALASSGLVARTGAGTAATRSIAGTTNKITVTNGDGVSGDPTLNIGTDVVTLTDTQSLSNKTLTSPTIDDAATFNHETTPANPSAGKVKLYPKNDNNFYTLDSNGVETQIGSGSGSGSGTLNIVDNPSAASATTGWTAATNYSVSRNTTDSPLEGIIDTCFAISTTTASSESATSGVYAASLAMPVALRNTKTQVSLYLTTPASTAGVWRLSVYNASSTRMTLSSDSSSVTTLPANFNGQFVCTFDADSSATYTISLTQTTRTNANTLYVTNISIGNGITAQGAAVSSEVTYTPSSAISNATTDFRYTRVGEKMFVAGTIKWSNAGSMSGFTAAQIFPSGYTIKPLSDSGAGLGAGKFNLGPAEMEDFGTQSYNGFMVATYTDVSNAFTSISFTNALTAATAAFTPGANDTVTFSCWVKVAEWSGSGTVNLGPGAQVEYAYNSSTATAADDTSSFAYGPGGAQIQSITAALKRRVRFQYPIQPTDQIVVEVSIDQVKWIPVGCNLNGNYVASYEFDGSTANGIGLQATPSIASTDIDIAFGTNRVTGVVWGATVGGYYWRAKKYSPSSPVGFGLAGTDGSSGLYKAGQAPGLTTGATISAGYVGQVLRASNTSGNNVPASGSYGNGNSITLTAGTWLIKSNTMYGRNGATFSSPILIHGVTTTTGNSSTGLTNGVSTCWIDSISTTFSYYTMPPITMVVRCDGTTITREDDNTAFATGTTLYQKLYVETYSAATPQYYGSLVAIRIA